MPHIFNGVQVWRFRGSLTPCDLVVLQETSASGCMFWIVILHETMSIWVDISEERQQCFLQHIYADWGIHDSQMPVLPLMLMPAHGKELLASYCESDSGFFAAMEKTHCKHIFALRTHNQLDTFEARLCTVRWTRD